MGKDYIVFQEYNSHEGETWEYYINYDEELLSILEELGEKLDCAGISDSFSASLVEDVDKEEVLKRLCNTSYAPGVRFIGELRKENVKKLLDIDMQTVHEDCLYKGGIMNYRTKDSKIEKCC